MVIWATSGSSPAPLIVFGVLFLAGLGAVCIRQAALEGRMREAVVAERALREEAERRRQDLEALTALAAAMTGSLEEAPIVERGLAALELASGATAAELRLDGEDGPRAVLGDPAATGAELSLDLNLRTTSGS